jgi:hypothetical protein
LLASRLHWRLLTGLIVALVATAWLAPRWIPAPDLEENRVLAARPDWPKRLRDLSAFCRTAEAYVADHFPSRPHLIGVLNRLRMLFGVSGADNVIVGRHGWLFFDDASHFGPARGAPPPPAPQVRDWLNTLAGRTEWAKAHSAYYLVVVAPVKEVVYPQYGPAWFRAPNPERPTVLLPKLARATGAGDVLYLYPEIAQATARGVRTFSLHDSHWTGQGAYAGYVGLMNHLHALGLAEGPQPLSFFREVARPRARLPRDLARMLGVGSFVDLDFAHYASPLKPRLQTTYLTAVQDWTGPQVIDTGEVGKPTLMMSRDSFSIEVLPFLFSHVTRIVLVHNKDGLWRPDVVERFRPDIVVLEAAEWRFAEAIGDVVPAEAAALGPGPPPSAEASARIDQVLARVMPSARRPDLAPPGREAIAAMAAAKPAARCNFEAARLRPDGTGAWSLTALGWIAPQDIYGEADGLVALAGAGVTRVAPLPIDRTRTDVVTYLKDPRVAQSGFAATYRIRDLPPGIYSATVYRRTHDGWIACPGQQTLDATQAVSK